jgi:tetratricopeptide (TPR) repeat protein
VEKMRLLGTTITVLRLAGNKDAAIRLIEDTLQLFWDSDNAFIQRQCAELSAKADNWKNAYYFSTRALLKQPHNMLCLFYVAISALNTGRLPECNGCYSRMVEIDPDARETKVVEKGIRQYKTLTNRKSDANGNY